MKQPKYFRTKQDQLHCEAFAMFLLIDALWNERTLQNRINPKTGKVKTGVYWIRARANTRVARRFTHKVQAGN